MLASPGGLTTIVAALAVTALLVALCRWAFGGPRRPPARSAFGLLMPVRVLPDAASADALLTRLTGAGIRATAAPAGPGFDAQGRPWPDTAVQVLVFPGDFERARELSRVGLRERPPG